MIFTDRIEKAIEVSAVAHRNQSRKGGNIPYAIHPFSVMLVASQVTDDEDTLIACLFHDILEDVPEEYPEQQMRNEFGDRVVAIVKDVTKDSNIIGWQAGADAYLDHIKTADDAAIIVCASDKIHNIMSTVNDHKTLGNELWGRFSAGQERQIWWYKSILTVITERKAPKILISQLSELVSRLDHQTSQA